MTAVTVALLLESKYYCHCPFYKSNHIYTAQVNKSH